MVKLKCFLDTPTKVINSGTRKELLSTIRGILEETKSKISENCSLTATILYIYIYITYI